MTDDMTFLKTHCCQPQERSSLYSLPDFSFSTKLQPISIIKTGKYMHKKNQPINVQCIQPQQTVNWMSRNWGKVLSG